MRVPHFTRVPLLLWFALLFPGSGSAQSTPNQVSASNATGTAPYTPQGGVRENINLATGNVNLQIPLLTLPGRNGHNVTLALEYDSQIWSVNHWIDDFGVDHYSWGQEWRSPVVDGLWRFNLPVLQATQSQVSTSNGGTYCYSDFILTLGDGSKHWFKNKAYCYHWFQGNQVMDPQYLVTTNNSGDGAFILLDTSNVSDAVAHFKGGTRIHFTPGYWAGSPGTFVDVIAIANTIVDPDGNKITVQSVNGGGGVGATASSITDTLGRVVTLSSTSVSYKDSSGTTRTITLGYGSVSMHPTFTTPAYDGGTGTESHLNSIVLPNGLSYSFQYSQYGELTKITYPTGGYTRYDYTAFTHWRETTLLVDPYGATAADFRELTARYVCRQASGTCGTEDTTTYTPTVDGTKTNNQYIDVRDPLANRIKSQFPYRTNTDQKTLFAYFSPRELTRWVYQGESTLLRTVQTDYNNLDGSGRPTNSSLPIRVTTTLNDSNQVSKVEWDYDTFAGQPIDNVTEQREYDYGTGAPGSLVRKRDYNWLKTNPINSQDYTATSIYILDRKASEQVKDAAGNIIAQSQFEYDSFTEGLTASGAVQHDASFSTTYTTRGKLTASKHWRNTDAAWLTTRNQYDDAGNLRKTTDPLSHATTFSFADSWGNSSCAPTGGNAAAYLTSATNALSQTSSSTYNSCSGTVASATDPNNQTTTFSYDLMGRSTQANLPDSGQATRTFNEASYPLSITGSAKITGAMSVTAPAVVDGLGRVSTSRLDSDPQGVTYTDTTYDALGRKATVSNPYRSTGDPTYGITSYQYDALGRVTLVIPPDGSQTSNNVSTGYSGNCSTVTDQAGKKRKACTDALGRLTQMFEPDATGNLVNETDYQYDMLNNLTRVDQKGNTADSTQWRTRTFVYNSLSQLTSASNPESGTITYTYDNDGNLITKTDARGVITTHAYDQLHRLTGKTYSNGDPAISYFYDQTSYNGLTITNGKGRRTGMSDAAGAEAWSYDVMGRVLSDRRTTNGVTKTTSYTYNLDGSLATLTYPSGRVITYTPNAAGRVVAAVDTVNSINYALSASYAPHGMLASLQNGVSLVSTYYYNNRLQPCRISVKSSGTAPTQCSDTANVGNVLDFTYGFSLGTADNGNVASILNNRNHNRDLSYTYDQLNRVATAQSAATSGTDCWGLQFGYDVWANLLSETVTKCSAPALSVGVTTQNKINNTGFSYDAAGNLTGDGSFSYTWDAESRMKSAAGVNYTYDGDDRRVQKSNGKLYWYGMGSDPLAESDAAGNITNEYIFFDGKRVARRNVSSGNVNYYFADHLGTSRVVTNATGAILDDSDFYPFGGERVVVSSSGNNYKFTGKERDAETGLDYLMARYYSSGFGRFVSPDAFIYANLADPQSFNQYTYVYNNPLVYTDPSGHLASGQAGYASEGVGAPNFRMLPGGGLGACDEGSCTAGTLITSWELTVVNADGRVEGTGIFFPSVAAGQAFIANLQNQQASNPSISEGNRGHELMDNREVQRASFKLFADAAYGSVPTERSMWVISNEGEYSFKLWPWSAESGREIWKGPPPRGAVAVVHTHPTNRSERPSPGDHNLAQGKQDPSVKMPVYVLHMRGIWKAVPNARDPIQVRDYHWVDRFKP